MPGRSQCHPSLLSGVSQRAVSGQTENGFPECCRNIQPLRGVCFPLLWRGRCRSNSAVWWTCEVQWVLPASVLVLISRHLWECQVTHQLEQFSHARHPGWWLHRSSEEEQTSFPFVAYHLYSICTMQTENCTKFLGIFRFDSEKLIQGLGDSFVLSVLLRKIW